MIVCIYACSGNWKWLDNSPYNTQSVNKSTDGGMAICISACEDYQIAADTAVRILICCCNAIDIFVVHSFS